MSDTLGPQVVQWMEANLPMTPLGPQAIAAINLLYEVDREGNRLVDVTFAGWDAHGNPVASIRGEDGSTISASRNSQEQEEAV
jgi:hypothetical protein